MRRSATVLLGYVFYCAAIQAGAQLPPPPVQVQSPTITEQIQFPEKLDLSVPSVDATRPATSATRTLAKTTPNDSGHIYSNSVFSASFNASATHEEGEVGTTDTFSSASGGIEQQILVHRFTADVPVDQETANQHAIRYIKNTGVLVGNKTKGFYQSHPYVAFLVRGTEKGERRSYRVWFIILNSRTGMRLTQIAPWTLDDRSQWNDFVNSVMIK